MSSSSSATKMMASARIHLLIGRCRSELEPFASRSRLSLIYELAATTTETTKWKALPDAVCVIGDPAADDKVAGEAASSHYGCDPQLARCASLRRVISLTPVPSAFIE